MAVTYTSTYAGPARFHGDVTDTDHPNYPEVCKLDDSIATDVQTALTAGFGANAGTLKACEDRVTTLETYGKIIFAKGITAEDTSTGVTASTNETAFTNLVQIPANTLAVNDRIRVTGKVVCVNNNSTDTVTLVLAFAAAGGLVSSTCILASVAAVDAVTAVAWHLEADLRVVAIGAAATAKFTGTGCSYATGGTPAFLATDVADDTSVATNAIIDVGITYDWSVSHADNQVRIKDLFVTVTRPST